MQETIEELLNLDGNDPVPLVNEQSLETMHNSLGSELCFPFDAIYSEPKGEDTDEEFPVSVHRLLPVTEHPVFGPYLGILCESTVRNSEDEIVIPLSRITDVKNNQNRDCVEAYNTWFWECR